jgi:hypothetical protein
MEAVTVRSGWSADHGILDVEEAAMNNPVDALRL